MTGLDQDLMQKNLTCKNLGDAQKNMFSFSVVLVVVNLLFLALGALLYLYGTSKGILQEGIVDGKFQLLIQENLHNLAFTERGTDELYPILAMDYLPTFITILFILGLVAAAYSSADSALTALTTSFCVDFLRFGKTERSVNERKRLRYMTQSGFSVLIFLVILVFHQISNEAVISSIFKAAGYTYGPLLGLYAFGLFTKMKVRDSLVPAVCLLSPGLSFLIDYLGAKMGFSFGFLLLLLNGGLTFAGLWLVRLRK
jgi:Na+/proline symporter